MRLSGETGQRNCLLRCVRSDAGARDEDLLQGPGPSPGTQLALKWTQLRPAIIGISSHFLNQYQQTQNTRKDPDAGKE